MQLKSQNKGQRANLPLLEDSMPHSEEYYKILSDMQEWPDWKIQAYNDCIATSAHANKLKIKVTSEEAIESWSEMSKKIAEANASIKALSEAFKNIENKKENHQMKFIIGNRGSGVTTDILLEASKFNRPIIVPMEPDKAYIKDKCVDLGIPCPDVYTFKQVKDGILRGQKACIVHISDVNAYLEWSLREYGFEGRIGTVSASLEAQFE